MPIQSLAVFCGSRTGNDPLFSEHATRLGGLLAAASINVVYGGGNKGIMGALANAVLQGNGKIIGVMPKVLTAWEHEHSGLTELIEVADMHVRKAMFYEKCDAAIILAGGYGTLDELFEILTWNQLSIHDKKIIILNSAGFYDHLIMHLKKMEEEDFLYDRIETKMTIITTPEEILPLL
ncbi:MAG: TIGR00730 family Rossman fold protein [Ginsengibacter sp.]